MASKLIELGLLNVLWLDRGSAGVLIAQWTPAPTAEQDHGSVPVAAAA